MRLQLSPSFIPAPPPVTSDWVEWAIHISHFSEVSFLNFIIQLAAWKSFTQKYTFTCLLPPTHTQPVPAFSQDFVIQPLPPVSQKFDPRKAPVFSVSFSWLDQALTTPACLFYKSQATNSTVLKIFLLLYIKWDLSIPLEAYTHTHTHNEWHPWPPSLTTLQNTQGHIACLWSTDIHNLFKQLVDWIRAHAAVCSVKRAC